MGIELDVLNWIQNLRSPVGDAIMPFVTGMGNGGIIWILLALVFVMIPEKRQSGAVIVAALCVDAVLCNVVLKNLVMRTRPCDVNTAIELLIARPRDYSFPSGHTAVSFAAVTALYLAGEKRIALFSCLLALLIAFSRMYLYVHYPTDILGGAVAGVLSGYLGFCFVRQVKKKRGCPDAE